MEKLKYLPLAAIVTLIIYSLGFNIYEQIVSWHPVAIQYFQYKSDDSLALGKDKSDRIGDSVEFVARVVAPPRVSPLTGDNRILLRGIVLRQANQTAQTGIDLIDTGAIIKVRGRVTEFPATGFTNSLTQLDHETSTGYSITVFENTGIRPTPKLVNITDFNIGDYPNGGTINYVTGEKYEGMYVELRNVYVAPGVSNRHPWSVVDENGNKLYFRDYSNFFSTSPSPGDTLRPWTHPTAGTFVGYIRGVIISANNTDAIFGTQLPYCIVPIYPNDLSFEPIAQFSAPILLTPENNSTGISLTPTLDWRDVIDAVNYRVQVSLDTSFTNLIYNQSMTSSQVILPSGTLNTNTNYFWRVSASNGLITSEYSAVRKFRTLYSSSLDSGLVAWYPLNGTPNDSSGYGRHGVLMGGASFGSDRFGNNNFCFVGNGTNSAINIPNGNFPLGNSSRSISVWYKMSLPFPTDDREIFGWGNNAWGQRFSIFTKSSAGTGIEYVIGSVTYPYVSDSTWHHFAVTYPINGQGTSSIKLYKDGVLQTNSVQSPQSSFNTVLESHHHIGSLFGSLYYWLGKIDDIRVYDRELTEAEVTKLYNMYSIIHTDLKNTEQVSGSRAVNCVILPGESPILPSTVKLYYSKDNPVLTSNNVMTNTGGNNWTANLPLSGEGLYRYYITATDSMGITFTYPTGAPGNTVSFTAATDTTKPVIIHTPLSNVPRANWPATINATATDNIGIDSVWVSWYKNNIINGIKQFKLTNTGENQFSGIFNSDSNYVRSNDVIFYRIFARDESSQHNTDSTALYNFKITNQITVTIGTGTISSNFPFYTTYEDTRTQYLYTSAELGIPASGGYITEIGFDVISVGSPAMNGFNIKMQNTSLNTLNDFIASGWTTVYAPASYTPAGTGWQLIKLTTPFFYNGTDNLLIEICYDNDTWSSSSKVNSTSASGMYWGRKADGIAGSCTYTGWSYTNAPPGRANTRFNFVLHETDLIFPAFNQIITTNKPNLKWSTPNNFSKIEISRDYNFLSVVYDTLINRSGTVMHELKNNVLQYDSTYFWRVCTENDTSNTAEFSIKSYFATLPYYQSYDSSWKSINGVKEAPDIYWTNYPATGNNSWRRQNEGNTANWTSNGGIVSPQSGTGAADFHTFDAAYNSSGALDFRANLSASGKKRLIFFYRNLTGDDNLKIQVSTDAGNTFGAPLLTLGSGYNWSKQNLILENVFSPKSVIRFTATSDAGADDIGIDSMAIYSYYNKNVKVDSIILRSLYTPGETVIPKLVLRNIGMDTINFPVLLTITSGYSSEVQVQNLKPDSTRTIIFAPWNTTAGSFGVTAISLLNGEEDPSNDTLRTSVNIRDTVWIKNENCIRPVNYGAVSGYSKNDSIWFFLSGGAQNSYSLMGYNPINQTYTVLPNLPQEKYEHGSAIIKDSLYITGGNLVSEVYRYNISSRSWQQKASMPLAIYGHGSAAYQDSLIYVTGGRGSTGILNKVFVYNIYSNSWRSCVPLPEALYNGGLSIIGNKLIYICGEKADGTGSNKTYVGEIDQNNRSTITWTEGASYPGGGKKMIRSARWGENSVLTSGDGSRNSYLYNLQTNTWVKRADYPLNISKQGFASVKKDNDDRWRLFSTSGDTTGSSLTDASYQLTELILTQPLTPALIQPVQGASGLVMPITFKWRKVYNAEYYMIQVAGDSLFNSIVVNDSTLTDTSKTLSNLNYNQTYYWRIRSKNFAGYSNYSQHRSFKTIGSPYSVSLISPLNNSQNQPLSIMFRWNKPQEQMLKNKRNEPIIFTDAAKTISKYWLEISTDSSFSGIFMRDTTLTDTVKTVNNLTNLTKYFWRVKATNEAGWGSFSEVWNFTTVSNFPYAPLLVFPADNAVNLNTTVTFVWLKAADFPTTMTKRENRINEVLDNSKPALKNTKKEETKKPRNVKESRTVILYRIEIYEDSLLAQNIYTDSTLTDTSRTVSSLLYNKSYYWRVNAKNEFGWGDFSAIRKFTTKQFINSTVNVVPDWNILSVPLVSMSMKLDSLFPGALSQAFGFQNGYVTTSVLENSKGYWVKFGTTTGYNVSGIRYSPQVVPLNQGWNLIGPFENEVSVSSLTTNPPDIISSLYYGYNSGYQTTLTLYPGKGYWVKSSQAGSLILPEMPEGQDGYTTKTENLQNNTQNYTRIRISDNAGRNMTLYLCKNEENKMSNELPPLPPQGIFDARYEANTLIEPTGKNNTIRITSAQYPVKITAENLNGRRLRIKDKVTGEIINQEIADGKEITIQQPIELFDILDMTELPATYDLEQNYPNPFNPVTTIKYQIPEDSYVKLVVFDILGREIKSLVNDKQNAGYYSVKFDGSILSSGVYFYRLETGNYKNVKRMVVLK